MGTINKAWHLAHKMPLNPTHAQRMKWHIGHQAHCTCRLPTPKLQQEMDEFTRGRAVTKRKAASALPAK